MSDTDRQLHLGWSIWPTGFHAAGWRLPEAAVDGTYNPRFLQRMARTAERGKLDFYFIGDRVVGLPEWQHERPNQVTRPEALTVAANVAAVTEHIGIVATVNTTYSDPYSLARSMAMLDHLSEGRAGWNIVTGLDEQAAKNFSRDKHWDNERRYDWADEFVEVASRLWDSWEDDAFVADKASGRFVDEAKIHRVDHKGEFFSVAGPLNIGRPPQGRVPLVHAGSSERSREFGAKYADIRFTMASDLDVAQRQYADLKGRLARYGRPRDAQKILPGLAVYVAETPAAAHAKYREIQDLATLAPDAAPLSGALGEDVSGRPLDVPLGELLDLASVPEAGRRIVARARLAYGDEDITLLDLVRYTRLGGGHREVVGDAKGVADFMEQWLLDGAADGFVLFPPYLPGTLEQFTDLVVPELQRRGLHRKEYTSRTFRSFFGLPRPLSSFAAPAGSEALA
ncbi:LLM class flavin-dependent oxidoreductase [Streptomyces sp. NPDC047002]|uniref:LLM class flavin-dependent oxidoreductase n=1 Tax=Streptomyces sp. NPDC047002 TaxID=3155475 RepID=UPI0034544E66